MSKAFIGEYFNNTFLDLYCDKFQFYDKPLKIGTIAASEILSYKASERFSDNDFLRVTLRFSNSEDIYVTKGDFDKVWNWLHPELYETGEKENGNS